MAQAVNVNFRMDADLKKSMEAVCEEMGLTMTAAFTIFAKKVSREKRIPFEVNADPFYSRSNLAHLEKLPQKSKSGMQSWNTTTWLRWSNAAFEVAGSMI